ncbi:MAG TPA: hypothetical protein VL357_01630 [Rariglobus sp.]|jgi:hypothetical protein|nr:hypothetical protein [Rariglobus sp.]
MKTPDSAQLLALLGASGGYVIGHYDQILAAACAAAGLFYTLWKWKKEASSK